ncbi:hypothetical protein ACET3Z_025929 [Daucus carota]
MGWAVDVAKRMGIKVGVVWFASAATLASIHSIPKLIEDGILNKEDGSVTKSDLFHLSSTLPAISSGTLMWTSFNDEAIRKNCFQLLSNCNQSMKLADFIICNSAYELEAAAFSAIPKVLPLSNQAYICEIWKTGLGFEKDEAGIIRQDEIVNKVKQLFAGNYGARALELQFLELQLKVREDGSSNKNLSDFIDWVKVEYLEYVVKDLVTETRKKIPNFQ